MKLLDFLKKDKETDILKATSTDDLILTTQIRKNLEFINLNKIHLIATIDNRPTTYKSMLLDIEMENKHIMIDSLMPNHGNEIITASNNISIGYNIEGIMYYFDSKFIEMVNEQFPSIKIAFPSIIKKVQKRNAFRVSPPKDNPITVKMEEGITEIIANISEGGISLYTQCTEEEIPVGTIFEKVTFKLPTMDRYIITKAKVKSFIKGSAVSKNRYGIEFTDMRMADKDSIANYVLIRQMEMIRNNIS